METIKGILQNSEAIITIVITLLIAASLFRKELRRYMARNARDTVFTIGRAELENVLNRSFEMNYQLAELTEIRINNQWEIRALTVELLDSQKARVRELSASMDAKLKKAFSEATANSYTELEKALHYQQFSNALHVVSTTLRTKIYDMCHANKLQNKDGLVWDAWIRQIQGTLTPETIDHLKSIYQLQDTLEEHPDFVKEAVVVISEYVGYALNHARNEAVCTEHKVNLLQKEVAEIMTKIRQLREEGPNRIVDEFLNEVQKTK